MPTEQEITMYLFLFIIVTWVYGGITIYLLLFRQKIIMRNIENYEQDYVFGRTYWLPDLNRGIVNWIFKKYYQLRKRPIPESKNLPFRRDHNDKLESYNTKYAVFVNKYREMYKNEIESNPELFGDGFRVMYIKTSLFHLWPKRIYFCSPIFRRRKKYYIYGHPAKKVPMLNPKLDHWVVEPSMELINGDAKLGLMLSDFTVKTTENRMSIGSEVEIGMLGDPDMVKDVHTKSSLLNPWINEESQIRKFLEETEDKSLTADQIRAKLSEDFGVEVKK